MQAIRAKQYMASKRGLVANSCPDFAQIEHPPQKRQRTQSACPQSPTDVALKIYKEHGIDADDASSIDYQFVTPTAEMIKGYTMETTKAVRDGNLKKIKELHASGVSLTCCNRFGDSLLHIACRRGDLEVVKFLLEEAMVSINIKDDMNRVPLHDALWTPQPQFELVALLLKHAPDHIFMKDSRGSRPFEYARKVNWDAWCDFLNERKDLLKPQNKRCISPHPSSP